MNQQAEARDHARVNQVSGDYEEHHHRYVRGWEYLGGTQIDKLEMDLVEGAFYDASNSDPQRGQVAVTAGMLRRDVSRPHVLVLLGEAGAGKRAAALRVLREAQVPRERIQWLLLDWDSPRAEQIPHTPGHAFILDLTNYNLLSEEFYTGLSNYQKNAEASAATLIILATPDAWRPGHRISVPSVTLRRPPAKEIAKTHLRYLAADRVGWLDDAPLEGLLTEGTHARDAARLAKLVADADENDKAAVKEEFTGWKELLRGWFDRHCKAEDLRERSLLVAAALLEGAPADVVMDAADQLFKEVGGVLPPGGALAGRDLSVRLETIKASRVGENISLEEERHGLAEAVLTHVWEQRPQLRSVLLEWASQISAANGIAVRHLRRITDALVQLSLLPGGTKVSSVASSWIDMGGVGHRRLALELLETMALHPVTGVPSRKQLYDWAFQTGTSEERATAVAELCAGKLGEKYPRVALTRLRLLASRDDGRARTAVAEAVRTLASTPEQRTLLLSEIVDWCESTEQARRQAGASTFLALTDITSDKLLPLPATADDDNEAAAEAHTEQLVVRGWRAALAEPHTAEAAHQHLAAWLDSPHLSDEQVLPLATTVLHGLVGEHAASKVLVGSPDTPDRGRTRRQKLLDRLVCPPAAPAEPHTVPAPGDEGASQAA